MRKRFRLYVLVLLFSALGATAACGGMGEEAATAPAGPQPAMLSADPIHVTAEPLPSSFCFDRPGFGVRLSVIVSTHRNVFLRRLRFDFTDRFGRRATPAVTMIATGFRPISPSASPVTTPTPSIMPNSSPIPIPGGIGLPDTLLSGGGAHRFPFFLEFGCEVFSGGTLIVIGDFDDRGHFFSPNIRVRVGS